MVREWRHIKSLKRFGRGLVPDGVQTTALGDLAMSCPACPQPGVNLPDGWEDTPEEQKYAQVFICSAPMLLWLILTLDIFTI